jgi:hypothetical protein
MSEANVRTVIFAGLGAFLCFSPSWAEEAFPPISADTYRALTCPQIFRAAQEVSREGFALSGLQSGVGGSDGTATDSAVILLWPAFANGSAGMGSKLRYATDQIDALEQASIDSQCSIEFKRAAKLRTP